LKIGNLSAKLESEIGETQGLSIRANHVAQMGALNALGPSTQDPQFNDN